VGPRVFADTSYWIALVNPADQWAAAARSLAARLGTTTLVTTDEVLVEFLAYFSGSGPVFRTRAVGIVQAITSTRRVTVIEQSRSSFLAGLDLFARRPDKGYSLVDCVSMVTMTQMGIRRR
jgi:predicted nucleic acid-binding protein